jgi:hypothetical protein
MSYLDRDKLGVSWNLPGSTTEGAGRDRLTHAERTRPRDDDCFCCSGDEHRRFRPRPSRSRAPHFPASRPGFAARGPRARRAGSSHRPRTDRGLGSHRLLHGRHHQRRSDRRARVFAHRGSDRGSQQRTLSGDRHLASGIPAGPSLPRALWPWTASAACSRP